MHGSFGFIGPEHLAGNVASTAWRIPFCVQEQPAIFWSCGSGNSRLGVIFPLGDNAFYLYTGEQSVPASKIDESLPCGCSRIDGTARTATPLSIARFGIQGVKTAYMISYKDQPLMIERGRAKLPPSVESPENHSCFWVKSIDSAVCAASKKTFCSIYGRAPYSAGARSRPRRVCQSKLPEDLSMAKTRPSVPLQK